jgi:hypothetical protein
MAYLTTRVERRILRYGSDTPASVFRLGAAVSVIQSVLFVVIGVAALLLGVDQLMDDGFASFTVTDASTFRILCVAFVLIAVLGLAVTPAERALIEPANAGFARFGAVLAYLGHAGTIAFFAWWLLIPTGVANSGMDLDVIAPINLGVMFELVFVGAWVWVITGVMRSDPSVPQGFLWLGVLKATSFWFTFIAFLALQKWMLMVGLGAVTFFTGPLWHLWIARIMMARVKESARAG